MGHAGLIGLTALHLSRWAYAAIRDIVEFMSGVDFVIHWSVFCVTEFPMTINARLDPDLRELLRAYCERTGSSRSEVLREALARHLKGKSPKTRATLYSLAEDLIPIEGLSGRQSRDVKRIMRQHWRGKRAA